MFTGLIEALGKISDIKNVSSGKIFSVVSDLPLDDIKIGDSISINGVCETVIEKNEKTLTFEAMKETLSRTNFSDMNKGDIVNVERAMALNSRLDGHIVSGHIDTTAKLTEIKDDGIAKIYKFNCDTNLVIEKGSIAINGISLTVTSVKDEYFEVSVLPFTISNTNLKYLNKNDKVNIEFDMFAKYIKKFTEKKEQPSKITKEFLIENGF